MQLQANFHLGWLAVATIGAEEELLAILLQIQLPDR